MAELLLEILSEEIPARMQTRASEDLARLVTSALKEAGLEIGEAMNFATPRRLVLTIADVAKKSPAVSEERKGPRVGAPDKALQGFLKAAGLKSIDDTEIIKDPKKGDYYLARIEKPGRNATDIIAEVIPAVCAKFPWPKSMHWGTGTFQWVRPLQSILCILDGKTVPFDIAGIESGNTTRGHRFHGPKPFTVSSFEDYGRKLKKNKVLLPASERASMISDDASELASNAKLELLEDDGLLLENAGLTEWPVALMGSFDTSYLSVPPECLTTAMKAHQKCFSLRDKKSGKLSNKFIAVANLIAPDGGKEIVAGNEKVIDARLADAKFFWEQDLKRPLDEMATELSAITFHKKLGSQKDRVERIAELSHQIAESVDADPEAARRAAQLAKADLVSGMVGEFPELQGLMGRYYAEKAGAKPEIARAIELHYKPKGPGDAVPRVDDGDAVAVAVALADKLDTLVGFWAINEKPTGSGDPYQLRRAALGVIRILIENDLRLALRKTAMEAINTIQPTETHFQKLTEETVDLPPEPQVQKFLTPKAKSAKFRTASFENSSQVINDLLNFFADRLKVYLRDQGKRHDLIDAVYALPGQDDLALIVKRVQALTDFLETDDGENLLAGVKRASNILSIEEKKDKKTYAGEIKGTLLNEPAERELAAAIAKVKFDTEAAINVENFEGAMRALAELRGPVDKFFDDVIVNADDSALRENRLKLLSEIRATTLNVADFSKISG